MVDNAKIARMEKDIKAVKSVPPSTTADAGKVLTVGSNGTSEWKKPSGGAYGYLNYNYYGSGGTYIFENLKQHTSGEVITYCIKFKAKILDNIDWVKDSRSIQCSQRNSVVLGANYSIREKKIEKDGVEYGTIEYFNDPVHDPEQRFLTYENGSGLGFQDFNSDSFVLIGVKITFTKDCPTSVRSIYKSVNVPCRTIVPLK